MKNYLIGIAIDIYESASIPNLSNAVRDTKTICDILFSRYGFETVKYLTDSEATNEKINQIFKEIHSK